MAIIQISRIIQRSGNLVDLPQLAEAELGWANDARRLFVGRGGSYDAENVEVLTSYSSISFGQLEGSYGNLDFSAPKTGQIITYDSISNAWVNTGGNAEQPANTAQYSNYPIHLGNVDNVKVGGGSLGYVLETDGQGNLSWSPKGSLYTVIIDLENDVGNGNVITMKVPNTTPYTNSQLITITGANISNSTASNNINGTSFYVKLADDFSISGDVTLYTDAGLVTTANGSGLLSYVANSGVATAVLSSGTGGGSGLANGITGAIQYKSTSGFLEGSSQLVWNTGNSSLNVSGNATLSGSITSSSLSATGVVRGSQIVSTATSPTSPIVVSSSIRIANANVQTAGNLINGTSNVIVNTNGNITISVAGASNVVVATTSGVAVTGNANIGNIGTTGLITATGNIQGGNLSATGRVQSTGLSTSWGITTGNSVGALNAVMGVSNSATWLISGTSGGVFKAGIQVYDSTPGELRIYEGANIIRFASNQLILPALSVTGNIVGTGILTVTGNANVGNMGVIGLLASTISATGNANVANINATNGLFTNVTANANITSSNGYFVSANANLGYFLNVSGNNVGKLFYNQGAVKVEATDTTSHVQLAANGTVRFSVFANGLSSVNGSLSISGNANIGNTITRVISTGANTTTGTITGNWSLTSGSRLQATYADLAEYYASDYDYEPGTVLEFGGNAEVTLATEKTPKVAGVVSTNPSYVMNSNCAGDITVALALQGRVPVKVKGIIKKGDLMVSGGGGYAISDSSPKLGTIIGKALENFDGAEGTIEVAIGRL